MKSQIFNENPFHLDRPSIQINQRTRSVVDGVNNLLITGKSESFIESHGNIMISNQDQKTHIIR